MSVVRARKEAAKRLALALQTRYRRLIESNGKTEDEIVVATSDMAMGLYENVEFIINALKDYGGLEARFEPMTRPVGDLPKPANDLPQMPAIFAAGRDVVKPH